jgi:hypothetical protein
MISGRVTGILPVRFSGKELPTIQPFGLWNERKRAGLLLIIVLHLEVRIVSMASA